ncbi:DUF892 family protein [Flexithrix dorotheae]|uniref:DUF892 family protein n=1 Tax=Flexithrix dorotheae TaxID=70993 RepID=UPI0003738D62|nr:DUF892 family protein [Flexithrix dorotheae]
MKPINNLQDLLLEQLKDCYDSELQQIEAFPQLMEKSQSLQLKNAIKLSLEKSEIHLKRLERMLSKMGIITVEEICEGTLGTMNEIWTLMSRITDKNVLDAAIITCVQHIHHHDIAGYGTICAFAKALGNFEMASTIHEMLEEEKNIDKMLTDMAIESINFKARDKDFMEATI